MQNLIFDLDGTLVDSRNSIHASLNFALEQQELEPFSFEQTQGLIGMPLLDIFCEVQKMSLDAAERAIADYRRHYAQNGRDGTQVYPEVAESLAALKGQGYSLYIATVKPGPVAQKVLDEQGFLPFFQGVSGSSMDSSRRDKADIIAHALHTNQLRPEASVMIGDRHHDIRGANLNGLASIGVSYGYGSREELLQAGADQIIDCMSQLSDCVSQWNNCA